MTSREMDYHLAVKVMGWTLNNYETSEECDLGVWLAEASSNDGWDWLERPGSKEAWQWSPTENAEDSKMLREKLAEKWDTTLGQSANFAFAMWPKGTIDKYSQPKHLGVDDNEYMAIALCALKAIAKEEK